MGPRQTHPSFHAELTHYEHISILQLGPFGEPGDRYGQTLVLGRYPYATLGRLLPLRRDDSHLAGGVHDGPRARKEPS